MHGLINRSMQNFLVDTYGRDAWCGIASGAGLDEAGFETMLTYEDALTLRVLDAAAGRLGKSRETVLEDMGTYLVSHPNRSSLRRLLRFGGDGFVDFLHSLDDLPDRARLAVPDLEMPILRLRDLGGGQYRLDCGLDRPEVLHVVIGALRAVADDYGALAIAGTAGDRAISIHVLSTSFAEGRQFDLAPRR